MTNNSRKNKAWERLFAMIDTVAARNPKSRKRRNDKEEEEEIARLIKQYRKEQAVKNKLHRDKANK